MNKREMNKRRRAALVAIDEAIQQLGPITDETKWLIREPLCEIISTLYDMGDELNKLSLDIYNRKGEAIVRPVFKLTDGTSFVI